MRPLLALPLLLLAAPAAAQTGGQTPGSTLGLPQGCTASLSMLDRSCFWNHVITCEGDPADSFRHVVMTDGGFTMTLMDADNQLLESFDSHEGITWRLGEATSRISLRSLLRDGAASYDFTLEADDGSGALRIRGEDRLTGRTATLDGLPVEVTEFSYEVTEADGGAVYAISGEQYVTEDPPASFFGTENYGEAGSRDLTPTDLVLPGEEGFLSIYAPESCFAALDAPAPAAKPERAK